MSKRVVPHDLLSYRFLSSPKFSPDGGKIAFSVHRMDLDKNCYRSDIWLYGIDGAELTHLTTAGSDRTFCWSVDGRSIIFVSSREPGKKAASADKKGRDENRSDLYSISISGGEAVLLGSVPSVVTAMWDLGDGRLLLKHVCEPEEHRFEDADYMVFRQVPFCTNGKGFTAQKHSALSVWNVADAALTRLSPADMNVGQVRVAHDGSSAIAVATVFTDVMPETSGVWRCDLKNNKMDNVLPQDVFAYDCADSFNGGVIVTGTDMKAHGHNENVRFYLAGGGAVKSLTPKLDVGLRNSVICDCRYGLSDMNLAFCVDSGKAWYVSTDGYVSHLHTVDAGGVRQQVTEGLKTVEDYCVMNGRAAVIGLEDNFLQELYLVENGVERRLTSFNREAFDGCDISVPEYVHLDNGTEWGLDCWYMRPLDFEVGKKYPTILHVHGGPKMTFGDVFVHEMQCWAAENFVVLFCNPRGSDGKGNAFDDIRGKYGTIDYDDLMLFTDWAVKTLPFVDPDRLGVTGGSYGGFMTNWIIGHTSRFRAAVTQRSICNWISMAGVSDIGYFFSPDQQGADIWSNHEKMWWHSPLKYLDKACTPTLIIHSDEDHRCEVSQGLQLFTALKRNGVESKMCVFKGENHELSRSGRPKQRLARLQEIIQWFREHL